MRAFCGECQRVTEHRHMHSTAHGIGTHITGSERYECILCRRGIFREEGTGKGLDFVLDRGRVYQEVMPGAHEHRRDLEDPHDTEI